ncbi:MAG: hypothetical protein HRU70_07750 [Phycisphaeraceae bacterium]|nr:MAG: hypothetical protein HRU70_07750 [Phycisphaeraceae bacterium]
MPPLPRLSTPALADLVSQLRYVPPETLLRQVDRIESLAREIDAATRYPADWIVFKVTGFRPDRARDDGSSLVLGSDLLRDLSAASERMSAAAGYDAARAAAHGAVPLDELARAWRVSVKTIERFRRAGLTARRCLRADGRWTLVFSPKAVEWFSRAHAGRIASASAFSRAAPDEVDTIVARAEHERASGGPSLTRAARSIGPAIGRSAETVRRVLKAEDLARASAGLTPIFGTPGSITGRARRAIDRADRWGIDPGVIAARWGCTRAAARRAVAVEHARRLVDLSASGSLDSPSHGEARADASSDLESLAASHPLLGSTLLSRLGVTPADTDLAAWIESARHRVVTGPRDERARLSGYDVLRAWAKARVARLNLLNPAPGEVDRVETSLRWAARVKADLVRSQFPLLIETFESRAATGLTGIPPRVASGMVRDGIAAISASIDHHDPSKGSRLASPCALALNAVAARWSRDLTAHRPTPGRATSVLGPGVMIPDWTLSLNPWQPWIDAPWFFRARLARIVPALRDFLELRLGWSGERPLTLDETCARLGIARRSAAATQRAAVRAVIAARGALA